MLTSIERTRGAGFLLPFLAALTLAAAGCGGGDEAADEGSDGAGATAPAATSEAPPDTEGLVVGYSNPLASEEGLRAVGYGATQAIESLGLGWEVQELDSKLAPDKQVADIDTFVSLDAGGIMSWTLDPGAADAAYERASGAGIPVVGLNSESEHFASMVMANTDTTCIVAEEQAAYIADLVPNATVLAIGGPPVPSITLTTECFLDAADELGLEVLEKQDDLQGTQANGQKVMQSLLLKHPDAEAVWSFSDSTTLGAIAALKAAGKTIRSGDNEGVVVVSRNGVQAAIDAIRAGDMTATWDNNQALVGAAAIQVLKYHLVDGVAVEDLPERISIPSKRWDLTTIDEYAGPLERDVPLPIAESCPEDGCPAEIESDVTG